MRKFLPLCLSLLLLVPAAMAAPETPTLILQNVTYQVDWVYYDGTFAQISLRQTPNDDNVALVGLTSFDPDSDLPNSEMDTAKRKADRVIGSYCEAEFFDPARPEDRWSYGGSGGPDGRGLRDEYRLVLPLDASPDFLEARVGAGVRTRMDRDYEELGSFTVPMPKRDTPLLDTRPNLALGSTRVERVVVSRTPVMLAVQVVHAPSGPHDPSPFVVSAASGEKLQHNYSNTVAQSDGALISSVSTFWLDADAPLPLLRLTYHGVAQTLLVDLEAGTVALKTPGEPEPITLALDAVTYQVDWTYYDGYFAQMGLRQIPNDHRVALVPALAYDPSPDLLDDEMNTAAEKADRVIGSYCMADFFDPARQDEPMLSGAGSTAFYGRGLSGESNVFLPLDISPETLLGQLSVGVRTQSENIYDEWTRFYVLLPKSDAPLLDVQTDLNLGPTRVERVVISRTPVTLAVRILHAPSGPHSPSPFVVAAAPGEVLQHRLSDTLDRPDGGLMSSINTFELDANAPLPSPIRLTYHGAEQTLLVDLEAGTVALEPK